MQPPDERTFRAYLWTYWSYAVAFAQEAQPEQSLFQTTETVQLLCEQVTFDAGTPLPTEAARKAKRQRTSATAGFSSSTSSYWLKPTAVARKHGLLYYEFNRFFHPSRPLVKKLVPFAKIAEERWGRTYTVASLSVGNRGILAGLQGVPEEAAVRELPFFGILLIGSLRNSGAVWLGVRDDAALANEPYEAQALWLQVPEDYIVAASEPVALPWWEHATANADASEFARAFPTICQDLHKAIAPDLMPGPAVPVFVDHVEEPEAAGAAFAEALDKLKLTAGGEDQVLLVWTNLPRAPAGTAVLQWLHDTPRPIKQVVILTLHPNSTWFSYAPWVWSYHLGSKHPFQVVHRNRAHLLRSLITDEFSRAVVNRTNPVLQHPRVEIKSVNSHRGLLLTSEAGEGKTCALVQLLEQLINSHVTIVVQQLATSLDIGHVRLVLDACTTVGHEKVIMVVDNAHTAPERDLAAFEDLALSTPQGTRLLVASEPDRKMVSAFLERSEPWRTATNQSEDTQAGQERPTGWCDIEDANRSFYRLVGTWHINAIDIAAEDRLWLLQELERRAGIAINRPPGEPIEKSLTLKAFADLVRQTTKQGLLIDGGGARRDQQARLNQEERIDPIDRLRWEGRYREAADTAQEILKDKDAEVETQGRWRLPTPQDVARHTHCCAAAGLRQRFLSDVISWLPENGRYTIREKTAVFEGLPRLDAYTAVVVETARQLLTRGWTTEWKDFVQHVIVEDRLPIRTGAVILTSMVSSGLLSEEEWTELVRKLEARIKGGRDPW